MKTSYLKEEIYKEKNIQFKHLNSKLSVLNDDIIKILGLMNGDNYTIAAALLSDNNAIDHAGISLVRFADMGLTIRDNQILRNISI